MAILVLALLLAGGLTVGCGGSDKPTSTNVPSATTAAPTTTTPTPAPDIVISNFNYTVNGPLKPGQQVTIVNNDDSAHSVTADANGSFDVRVSGGGGTSTFTAPTTPGTYAFHCKYHTQMHGSLTVQ